MKVSVDQAQARVLLPSMGCPSPGSSTVGRIGCFDAVGSDAWTGILIAPPERTAPLEEGQSADGPTAAGTKVASIEEPYGPSNHRHSSQHSEEGYHDNQAYGKRDGERVAEHDGHIDGLLRRSMFSLHQLDEAGVPLWREDDVGEEEEEQGGDEEEKHETHGFLVPFWLRQVGQGTWCGLIPNP